MKAWWTKLPEGEQKRVLKLAKEFFDKKKADFRKENGIQDRPQNTDQNNRPS